ncbi:unnamed protein product [Triticum turgidum subsp. durum]|uniref:Uncharacterized protein n=1 Tax=Triticum turgidum subsp. durum TaxID=4567 RepID=A0A9R1RL98_TRITD|nr:unnamed protein product [Triticum turgidum subsp. durum]
MLGRQRGCGCCHTWAQQIIIMWSLVPTDCFLFQNGHDSCIFVGSKLYSNVTKSDGANTTTTQTSDAEGSAVWRMRTGREKGFLSVLRLLLSLMVVVIMTNSNFWT